MRIVHVFCGRFAVHFVDGGGLDGWFGCDVLHRVAQTWTLGAERSGKPFETRETVVRWGLGCEEATKKRAFGVGGGSGGNRCRWAR